MIQDFLKLPILKDRTAMMLMVFGFVLSVVNVVYVLINVTSQDFEVPVRYTQFGTNPIGLGEWFTLYEIGLFAAVIYVINTVLGFKVYSMNSGISKLLFGMSIVVLFFLLLVSRSIFGLSPA